MSKKINGFSDVFASQPAGVLSLCRIKESDLEMDQASTRTKTRQTAVTKKYNKVCRGYHLSSPSEWLGIEVALAA